MESCLYEGYVDHYRLFPKKHHFRYKLFMLYLDLYEISQLFQQNLFWSNEQFNIASFYRKDHYGNEDSKLYNAIAQLIFDKKEIYQTGPVRMLTHPRYFGYVFNPVSFYYGFDVSGKKVENIVAEINNTPWNEQYCYVLNKAENLGTPRKMHFCFDKKFHVSPFMSMAQKYDWYFNVPGEILSVHMDVQYNENKLFWAHLNLKRKEMNRKNLNIFLIKYPLMTYKVITGIYFQALLLWLKKTPFYEHPQKPKGK